MPVPPRKPENLPKNPAIATISSPKSLLAETHHRLSAQARPLMLADLDKYRYERRCKERSLSTTSRTTPSTGSGHKSVRVPPRGTERYCAWRCKDWKKNRYESVRECECGFEHVIVHPSEWKTTPAEAEWDYGVRYGGYCYRQRKVRFAEPVVTDVEVVDEPWVCEVGRERHCEWEWVEKEDVEIEIGGVAVDLGSEMGGVGKDPDEEMEDVFELLDPTFYLGIDGCTGAGMLDPADSRVNSGTKGGLGNSAVRVPCQPNLLKEPYVTRSGARERVLNIAGRKPGCFIESYG